MLVNEAGVDVHVCVCVSVCVCVCVCVLEFPCFLYDLWFLCLFKISLYIWKFSAHILLKPSLKDLRITLLAYEMNTVVW